MFLKTHKKELSMMAILFLLVFDVFFFHLCHLTSTDTTFDDKDGGDDDIDRHDGNEYT